MYASHLFRLSPFRRGEDGGEGFWTRLESRKETLTLPSPLRRERRQKRQTETGWRVQSGRVQHGIDKFPSSGFTRGKMLNALQKRAATKKPADFTTVIVVMTLLLLTSSSSFATTKGLSQIVTPDLQGEGDLSLSLQIQDKRIANPYQLQAELGLTKWAEVAVFRGFQPDEWILGTEIGLLTKEPFLLSVGFVNWSPHLNVDPQPRISKLATTPSITR